MSPPPATEPSPHPGRTWSLRLLRVLVTGAAFAWVLGRVDGAALGAAMGRVPPLALAAAAALLLLNVVGLGTLRWRALLAAYGGAPPGLGTLARLNLVGFFYNTWLPGGIGGDVVRGVASRDAFAGRQAEGEADGGAAAGERGGATGAVAVVLVERTLGLVGLLVVAGAAAIAAPLRAPDGSDAVPGLLAWSALGIAAGVGAVGAVALSRRLADVLPGPLARVAAALPSIARAGPFALACGLSLAIHVVVALLGHVVIAGIDPGVPLATSLVVVPVAMATQFLPITVGGAGARELAFVVLYGAVGVAEADALATGLVVLLVQLAVGALGGLTPLPSRG
jgi:glycosyltransferase 2 family protein